MVVTPRLELVHLAHLDVLAGCQVEPDSDARLGDAAQHAPCAPGGFRGKGIGMRVQAMPCIPSFAPPSFAPPSFAPPSFTPPSFAPPSFAPPSFAPLD